ncbi:hypothetical protein DXB41_12580 [Segatella copri]|nr:hypothetical protein DXB41_12580 [Segatella copri]
MKPVSIAHEAYFIFTSNYLEFCIKQDADFIRYEENIKEHEHFEKFMGYKAPEFKSDSGEFHVILWNLNYISNNKNEYAIGRFTLISLHR